MALHYDASMMRPGEHGPDDSWFHHGRSAFEAARLNILSLHQKRKQGWLDLPNDEAVARIEKAARAFKTCDTLLVLGIGGSDLGARAIMQALAPKKRVLFSGANTDPDELASIFATVDWKRTAVNVISKSGNTVETMSTFFLARERLKKTVGKSFAKHIIATTDAKQGALVTLAAQEGYARLMVPDNIGGRFSVLTDVGLFPAAWAGVSIQRLLVGASRQTQAFRRKPVEEQAAARYAMLHAEAYQKAYRHIFVLMPYAARLSSFAFWYRQLIAESLGKRVDREGNVVMVGPTPVAALGATDQHSQLQLYMDGPQDKVITFLEVGAFETSMRVPKPPIEAEAFRGLAGRSLQDLIHAERKFTAEALASVGRPNGTITIPKLDAEHLGELFQFFMNATAYLGERLNIDAYDQPGVEEGKRRFHAWLRGSQD